ncbi:MAG: MBL fold metallo-hydrolase [Candidatus Andersenbacteria bacterium]|nr:MBL fold metallo-hydrolase [Candidatus Andersenbacteria bacterium]
MVTRAVFVGLACIAVIATLSFVPNPADKVVFLDVGQGDAILLQQGTAQVLIDGGPGMAVLKRLGEELPWFDRRIEVVVLTHPQQDHLEGLLHVLERYEVGLVLLPRVAHDSQLQAAWLQELLDRSVPYRFVWAGQRLVAGDLTLQFLWPADAPAAGAAAYADINNASIVTRAEFGDLSILLTGDAEARVERLLAGELSSLLDVDVLKAGHHGSNSSTHPALLAAVTPSAVVISVGVENRFGHPYPAVLGRLAGVPLWRTDQHGSVRFLSDGRRWWVGSDRR